MCLLLIKDLSFSIIRPADNVWQKIELYPTKTASQRTQLSGEKLKKKKQATDVLKLRRIRYV